MAEQLYQIITRDGSPMCDTDGNEILFGTREAAEKWLRPGERVELVEDPDSLAAEP